MIKINEIFCSVQGEGHFTGTAAVFIRTSGCNLRCSFCDTEHEGFTEMSVDDIVTESTKYASRHAVITGGEPSLQAELPQLVEALHKAGFFVQIETNGTCPLPNTIDWVTCSPKITDKTIILNPDELKVVFENQDMSPYERLFHPKVWSLQPCDTGNEEKNKAILNATIDYVLAHPQWKLSLQTHKLIGVR